MRTIILLLAALLCGSARYPQPVLVGTVTRVIDGDTIAVQLSSGTVRVRLYGIDAPEHNQQGGSEATMMLRALVAGKKVSLGPVSQDRYSRLVAKVYQGRVDVNAEMVARGEAWVYRHYLQRMDRGWCVLESQARSEHRGLWATRDPLPPWNFRHRTAGVGVPPCS
jgi:micrococcal nuclease